MASLATFRSPDGSYALPVPAHWSVAAEPDGTHVFSPPGAEGTLRLTTLKVTDAAGLPVRMGQLLYRTEHPPDRQVLFDGTRCVVHYFKHAANPDGLLRLTCWEIGEADRLIVGTFASAADYADPTAAELLEIVGLMLECLEVLPGEA